MDRFWVDFEGETSRAYGHTGHGMCVREKEVKNDSKGLGQEGCR